MKRIYSINLSGVSSGATVDKTLVRELLGTDYPIFGGLAPEKLEGLAVTKYGDVWIANDNDGVDDNNGETLLVNLGPIGLDSKLEALKNEYSTLALAVSGNNRARKEAENLDAMRLVHDDALSNLEEVKEHLAEVEEIYKMHKSAYKKAKEVLSKAKSSDDKEMAKDDLEKAEEEKKKSKKLVKTYEELKKKAKKVEKKARKKLKKYK